MLHFVLLSYFKSICALCQMFLYKLQSMCVFTKKSKIYRDLIQTIKKSGQSAMLLMFEGQSLLPNLPIIIF